MHNSVLNAGSHGNQSKVVVKCSQSTHMCCKLTSKPAPVFKQQWATTCYVTHQNTHTHFHTHTLTHTQFQTYNTTNVTSTYLHINYVFHTSLLHRYLSFTRHSYDAVSCIIHTSPLIQFCPINSCAQAWWDRALHRPWHVKGMGYKHALLLESFKMVSLKLKGFGCKLHKDDRGPKRFHCPRRVSRQGWKVPRLFQPNRFQKPSFVMMYRLHQKEVS